MSSISFMHLKSLYDAYLTHGYVSQCFKTGMIIPVSKCNVINEMSCDQFRLFYLKYLNIAF